MKQVLFLFFSLLLLLACNNTDKPAAETPAEETKPLSVSKNSEAFNMAFENMLNAYLLVKDALVEYDTAKANTASRALSTLADSLNVDAIKGDTSGTIIAAAKTFAGTIAGSAKGLAGETDLVKKKKEFQMISDAFYDLVRIVKYDRRKIYHQHCPMAFNDDEGADWISISSEIVNPYLGKKHPKYKDGMLHCGDVTDSLDFGK
jgi:hypothetical protein